MNKLKEYFKNNEGNGIHKWHHYLEVYEFWFKSLIGKPITILEIGIFQGGSLKMWRDFFGDQVKIYGIDVNPECKRFEDENTHIFIGSQEDENFLETLKNKIPKIDILIDDGGHTMNQQKTSFDILFDHVKSDGMYIIEDLHTSYWKDYGGGYKNPKSFIEYSKNFIDWINAWNSRNSNLEVNNLTRNTFSLHYYPSLLLIKKRAMVKPTSEFKGEILIKSNFPDPRKQSLLKKTKLKLAALRVKLSFKFKKALGFF
jgi:cephalosporin hydroxylase